MPLDFVIYVEQGLVRLGSGGWLAPASVRGLDDADFVTLPPDSRAEIFQCVDEFRAVAEKVPNVDAAQETAARAALERLGELLRPYRTRESRQVLDVLWAAWQDENARAWAPTFDYQLDEDWSGDPCVRVWLVLADGVDRLAPAVWARRRRLERLIHVRLQEFELSRYPYFRVRQRSEVVRPTAGTVT